MRFLSEILRIGAWSYAIHRKLAMTRHGACIGDWLNSLLIFEDIFLKHEISNSYIISLSNEIFCS